MGRRRRKKRDGTRARVVEAGQRTVEFAGHVLANAGCEGDVTTLYAPSGDFDVRTCDDCGAWDATLDGERYAGGAYLDHMEFDGLLKKLEGDDRHDLAAALRRVAVAKV